MPMEKLNEQTAFFMNERFGKDSLISLATAENNMPFVRTVNACYRDGAFYVITYALSGKMQQIKKNPAVSVCGDWFTSQGTGENLGFVGKAENAETIQWLKEKFGSWIDNGHTDFQNENTVLLKIRLTQGVLFRHGTRYDIDFT